MRRDIRSCVQLAHALQMGYSGIHTTFVQRKSCRHSWDVLGIRKVYVSHMPQNSQFGTHPALGFGIGPVTGVSICIAYTQVMLIVMVSELGGVLDISHCGIVEISPGERHFGNPVPIR